MKKIRRSDEEWRQRLTDAQYKITRKSGTEPAGSHPLNTEKRNGTYSCVGCGAQLFLGDTKYESGSGWPSFFAPASPNAVAEHPDNSLFRRRTEVRCANCDAHLGHVFDDGPQPTGQRYCMNGTAMTFRAEEDGGEADK